MLLGQKKDQWTSTMIATVLEREFAIWGSITARLVHVDRGTLLPVSVPGTSHFRPNPPWFSTSSTRDNDSEHKSLRAATSHLFGIHFCAQTAAT